MRYFRQSLIGHNVKSAFLTLATTTVVLALSGCLATPTHIIRFDKEPGRAVDLKAYNLELPLCLKTDPKGLRLTNEDANNGQKVALLTLSDGKQFRGTWFMYKSSSQNQPPLNQIGITYDWRPAKTGSNPSQPVPMFGRLDQFELCANS